MCGFVVFNSPGRLEPSLATEMLEHITRRGPDEQRSQSMLHVSMSHARLSVVGDDAGQQPMKTDDGRYWVVFNGEIYNCAEIKALLAAEQVFIHSNSDTEVLLYGYAQWGHDLFRRLDGMFAAVIWDTVEQRMVCARDRFGIKPLFLAQTRLGGIVISSEIAAFKKLRDNGMLSTALHPDALREFLTMGYVLEPTTWYQDTIAVTPGTVVSWPGDALHAERCVQSFWTVADAMTQESRPLSAIEGRDLLMRAVQTQLPDDPAKPFSIFLSGGVDSSLLASLARHQRPDASILAVSGFFSGDTESETLQAYRTAQRLDIPFLPVGLSESVCVAPLAQLEIFREPFADNASIPTYELARTAVRHGKIVFSGDGADEMFFGYRNHWLLHLESALKPDEKGSSLYRSILQGLSKISSQSSKLPRVFRWKSTLQSLLSPMTESYIQAFSQASTSTVNALLGCNDSNSSIQAKLTAPHSVLELEEPMKVVQWMDLNGYLPSCILKKTDRATMAAGLESRVPFLSNALTSTMLSQSSLGQVGFRSGKHLLREWAGPFLGDAAKAPKKSFTSPLDKWFSLRSDEDLAAIILQPLSRSVWSDKLDLYVVKNLISEHKRGTRSHGPLLWSLMQLSKFEP